MAGYGYKAPSYGAKTSKPPAKNYASLYGLANDYSPFPQAPSGYAPGGVQYAAPTQQPKATPPVKAPTVKPPSGAEPQQPQAPVASGYDWSADPILQKVKALGVATAGNAQAEAGKLKSQAAIQYGDEGIARQLVGDEGTALAAKANPFSIVNMLRKDFEDENRQEDQQFNKSNLYYSGARADEMGRNATGYQQRSAEALGGLQGLFGEIDANLLQALMGVDREGIDAEQAARDRAVDYGGGPGAGAGTPGAAGMSAGAGATTLRPYNPNDPFLQAQPDDALLALLRRQQGNPSSLMY